MGIHDIVEKRKLYKGAKLLHDTVVHTMGPKGKDVLIRNKYGQVSTTHDGITVAKAVWHKDKTVQNGIELLRDGGKGMNSSEDGSTTVQSLAFNLIKNLRYSRKHPLLIREELDSLVPGILDYIDMNTRTIERTERAVYDVAKTSAKDNDIAKVVTEMVVGTGYKGAITVETRLGVDTSCELVDGYLFNSGFTSKLFITDQKDKSVTLDNPAILLINGRAGEVATYAQFINDTVEAGHNNVLLVGDDIDNDLQNTLILTSVKSEVKVVFVRNTLGYDYLNDLEAVTGATIYSPKATNEMPTIEQAGYADTIIVKETETLIINGQGEKLNEYIKSLDETTDAERISFLTGKIGHITVGGVTETQAKERKDRVDDAIGAARAALKGGIVPGAGITLAAYRTGTASVDKALRAPYGQLLKNAGIKYRLPTNDGRGIDLNDGKEVYMEMAGIVDASPILKEIVRNAFAVAGTFLTVGSIVNEKEMTQEQLDNLLKMSQ